MSSENFVRYRRTFFRIEESKIIPRFGGFSFQVSEFLETYEKQISIREYSEKNVKYLVVIA
jgi:hypothetical protein